MEPAGNRPRSSRPVVRTLRQRTTLYQPAQSGPSDDMFGVACRATAVAEISSL